MSLCSWFHFAEILVTVWSAASLSPRHWRGTALLFAILGTAVLILPLTLTTQWYCRAQSVGAALRWTLESATLAVLLFTAWKTLWAWRKKRGH